METLGATAVVWVITARGLILLMCSDLAIAFREYRAPPLLARQLLRSPPKPSGGKFGKPSTAMRGMNDQQALLTVIITK
jgi:hypothetical protein